MEHYANIHVCLIRAFLLSKLDDLVLADAANKLLQIMQKLLNFPRNRIRDRVTVKNYISLFLLMSLGDYFLDTNVRPLDKVNLPRFSEFYAPAITHDYKGLDVWMLYSPPNEISKAQIAFNHYFTLFCETEKNIFAAEGYSEKYYKTQGSNITEAVQLVMPGVWLTDLTRDSYIATIKQLKIAKYYFDTHNFNARFNFESDNALSLNRFLEDTGSTPLGLFDMKTKGIIFEYFNPKDKQIFAVSRDDPNTYNYNDLVATILSDNFSRFKELIAMHVNVDQQVSTPDWQGLTALHLTILRRQVAYAELLFQQHARVDIEATEKSTSKKVTALDMMHNLQDQSTKNTFLELYNKYYPALKAAKKPP